MPIYNYRAIDHGAQVRSGSIKAAGTIDLERLLAMQGLTLIEARKSVWAVWQDLWQQKFSEQKLRDFTYLLKLVYSSGISLLDGLNTVLEGQKDQKLRDAIENLYYGVESGKSLSDCMQERPGIFPEYYVQMIRAGEMSGTMDKSVESLLEYLEWQTEFNKTIRSYFAYPLTIMSILALLGMILMIFVFPGLMEVFNKLDITLPMPTRILLGFTGFTQKYWLVIGGILVAAGVSLKMWLRTPNGRKEIDALILAIPVIGPLVNMINLSRYFKTLATVYASGLDVRQTFAASASVINNMAMREKFAAITDTISSGESISRAFISTGDIQHLVLEMVAMGERTGNLDSALMRVCGIYDREVPETIKKMFAVIEPLTVLIMGGMVLIVLLAIFLPIYGIVGGIAVR